MKITRQELINKWFDFFESKGHVRIPSASVIPENDPSVLFTTAGMHPLVPYLLGQPHPKGKRLCDVQKCIRTGDIDEVGDNCHLTFFEMLGNWSLGDYFKTEKVGWSYEFLTSPKYLNLGKEQFAVTCFEGNENVPKDTETASLWESHGVPKDRIYFLPKSENWWEINRGPCGPDSEMFLDTGKPKCSPACSPACNCGKFMEIGNDVYMQYNRIGDTEYIPATQRNVDTGFGVERCLVVLNGEKSVYVASESFVKALELLETLSNKKYNDDGDEYTRSFRIICDHLRASTFILGDEKGAVPSNVGQGYILRRLIRRAIRHIRMLGVSSGHLGEVAKTYIDYFGTDYPELKENEQKIIVELNKEEEKFLKTIEAGTKEFEKVVNGINRKNQFMKMTNPDYKEETEIGGKAAFRLFDTFGFPLEMTIEMATEIGFTVDVAGYDEAFKAHQELARTTSAGAFKGGLADDSIECTRYHTSAHLLLAGLRKIFGDTVHQKGSNITQERLRFDVSLDRKLTDEEVAELEKFINDAIKAEIPVTREVMPLQQAFDSGALGDFGAKYGDEVSVYTIGNISKEICGGPHVTNTKELGTFKISKQEAVSAGVRRFKATLN